MDSSSSNDAPPQQPFWVDEPYSYNGHHTSKSGAVGQIISRTRVFIYVFQVAVLILIAIALRVTGLGWIFIALLALFPLLSIYLQRRTNSMLASAIQVQQHAREQTGASVIGSAVHVAGHPMLAREQPVVIALRHDGLSFFTYQDASPIDVLPVKHIQHTHTVVYDDERVPHVDVIVSAAQALQLTFTWRGQNCVCLFRQMRKVRPIDWYHAIKQAQALSRSQANTA